MCRLSDGESSAVEVIKWRTHNLLQQWHRRDGECVFAAPRVRQNTGSWHHRRHSQTTASSPSTMSSSNVWLLVWSVFHFLFFPLSSSVFFLSILLFCILTVHAVLAPRASSTAYQSNNEAPTQLLPLQAISNRSHCWDSHRGSQWIRSAHVNIVTKTWSVWLNSRAWVVRRRRDLYWWWKWAQWFGVGDTKQNKKNK